MTSIHPEAEGPLESALGAAELDTPPDLPRVSFAFIAVYALALFGIWMAINLPATITLALRLSTIDPSNKTVSYSLVSGVGTLVALLANPFFGRLSDRTRSRFGRRRPWLVVGLVGTTVGALIIGLTNTVALLVVGWVIMQAFINAAIAAGLAIISDRVPERQQGLVGAMSGTAAAASFVVGTFVIQVFPTSILAQMGLPMAVALVFGLALVFMLRSDSPASGDVGKFSAKEFFGSFYVNPRKAPQFAKFLVAFFMINVASAVLGTYTVYYLQDQLKVSAAQLPGVIVISSLIGGAISILFTPLSGIIADRFGVRRALLVAAAVINAGGIGVTVTSHEVVQYIVGQSILAVGGGALGGVYLTYAISTIPDKATIARDLGIVNIAFTLPFSIVPFVAPAILAIGGGNNYILLFVISAVVSVLSIPVFLTIKASKVDHSSNSLEVAS